MQCPSGSRRRTLSCASSTKIMYDYSARTTQRRIRDIPVVIAYDTTLRVTHGARRFSLGLYRPRREIRQARMDRWTRRLLQHWSRAYGVDDHADRGFLIDAVMNFLGSSDQSRVPTCEPSGIVQSSGGHSLRGAPMTYWRYTVYCIQYDPRTHACPD
ncbi:Uncharacterized protein PBTT_08832 [Plasmodiophora brassicae]